MASRSDIEAGKAYVTLYLKRDELGKGLDQAQAQVAESDRKISARKSEPTAEAKGIAADIKSGWSSALSLDLFGAMSSGIALVKDSILFLPRLATDAVSAVSSKLSEMATDVSSKFSQVSKAIFSTLGDIGNRVLSSVRSTAAGITGVIQSAIKKTSDLMQSSGQAAIYLGGGLAAAAAVIVGPLTAAANKFAENVGKWKETGKLFPEAWHTSAAALTLAINRVKDAQSEFTTSLGAAVAPMVAEAAEKMAAIVRIATTWVQKNQELIATVFRVATAVATAGSVLAAVGGTLVTLGTPTALAIGLFTALGAIFGRTTNIVDIGSGVWARYSDSVTQAAQSILATLRSMGEFAGRIMGGIGDAIRGEDLDIAVKVALTGMQLAWIQGLDWIASKTGGLFGSIVKSIAGGDWKGAATIGATSVEIAFREAVNKIADVWNSLVGVFDAITTAIRKGWNTALATMADSLLALSTSIKGVFDSIGQWIANRIDEASRIAQAAGLPIAAALAAAGSVSGATEKDKATNDVLATVEAKLTAISTNAPEKTVEQKNAELDQQQTERSARRAETFATEQRARTDAIEKLRTQLDDLQTKAGAGNADKTTALQRQLDEAIAAAAEAKAVAEQRLSRKEAEEKLRREQFAAEKEAGKDKAEKDQKKKEDGTKVESFTSSSAAALIAAGRGGGMTDQLKEANAKLTDISDNVRRMPGILDDNIPRFA